MTLSEILFGAGSLLLAWLSRASLKNRHSYGYYRFFGFEFVLLSIVSNLSKWFSDPLSPVQLVSWLVLLLSLSTVSAGYITLRKNGRVQNKLDDTTQLVTTGLYRFIRHPLYLSLILLEAGAVLKEPSLYGGLILCGGFFCFYTTARTEESVNAGKFGEAYNEYVARTRMFIPFLF